MKKFFLGFAAMLFLVACESNSTNNGNNNAAIAGDYVLTALSSDVAVDLNSDGSSSMDLMSETTCFDAMTISFGINGDFTSTIAEVGFDQNNVLTCSTSVQSGTYSYANNLLTITVNVNGGTATDSQAVVLTPTNLSFSVTDADVAQYFSGAAGTPASGITELDFVYTKQ
jgi:hypothetical protein